MGDAWLDISGIRARIRAGAHQALEEIGDSLAADARRRAPVRKVFREAKGFRRKFRRLSASEAAVATRRANDYYTRVQPNEFKRRRAIAHIANYATAVRPSRGSLNALERSRKLRILGFERMGRFTSQTGATRRPGRSGGYEPGEIKKLLTSRGAYEIKTGRAIHNEVLPSGAIRVQVGGALKASIGSEGVTETPTGLEVRVTAGIRYAKFVEFPTVHNAAQPFLRPALYAAREAIPRKIARSVGAALRR